jgi:hypothetical protein
VGVHVKFAGPIRIHAASGREGRGDVAAIERALFWSPKHNAGVSLETQHLSPADALTGWTTADAQASGLLPAGSYVDNPDSLLVFAFGAPVADFAEPSFVIDSPPLEIDGRPAPGKSVAFTRTEAHVHGAGCP